MIDSHLVSINHSPKKGLTKSQNEAPCLRSLDPETHYKVRKITTKINDSLQMFANEPSLGLYRIQEHIHRTSPALIERKKELAANKKKIEGVSYDMDYSITVVNTMGNIKQFTNISEALKSAIEMKKLLDEKEKQEAEMKEKQATVAKQANKSISENEIAEGYICPICYFAHENQDDLLVHWKREHSLETFENEVFGSIELTSSSSDSDQKQCRNAKLPSEGEEASEQ